MRLPICDALTKYSNNKSIRFHMPSHSGQDLSCFHSSANYDITELDFSDNLLHPNGIIQDSMQLTAKHYGAIASLYVTSGSTTSIQITLKTFKDLGYTIIANKTNHISFFNALSLFDIPYVITEDLLNYSSNKKIAFFVTSPDYYGNNYSNIVELSKKSKQASIPLIIDCTHGSHLSFLNAQYINHNMLGTIVIHSIHKTMPAYTGASIINMHNDAFIQPITSNHSKIHTTSPSYIIMASMEYAINLYAHKGNELYSNVKNCIALFESHLSSNYHIEKTDDISKIYLVSNLFDGFTLKKHLEDNNIFVEMAEKQGVLLIVTPFNCNQLCNVNIALDKEIVSNQQNNKAFGYEYIGKVSKNTISIYPPSTPIILAGTHITKEAIDKLNNTHNIILGLVNGSIITGD